MTPRNPDKLLFPRYALEYWQTGRKELEAICRDIELQQMVKLSRSEDKNGGTERFAAQRRLYVFSIQPKEIA
ncbi:MAG: hypothetical protein Q8K18_15595 [Burkholderiales bacterium]|nr:hypothetical protein [Burkholderiales bacterium]